MTDAMVTGRMPEDKKREGTAVLQRAGLSTSQAINLLFDKLIEEQDASFLQGQGHLPSQQEWLQAATFVDGLSIKRESRFHDMPKGAIKLDRHLSREARA